MPRRKKPVYHSDLPEHVIEFIARMIYPDIVAYYESEEGQREFAEWMSQQESEKGKTESEHEDTNGGIAERVSGPAFYIKMLTRNPCIMFICC